MDCIALAEGVWYKGPEVSPVHAEQPSLDKRDEDRIIQIDTDLYTLNRQMTDIEDRLCFILERLKRAALYTSERVVTDSVVPA